MKKQILWNNNLQKIINALKVEEQKNPIIQLAKKYGITEQNLPSNPIRLANIEIQLKIKDERKKQNLTQRELAKKANMSQASIARAEKNLYISLYALIKIINALNKKIDFI